MSKVTSVREWRNAEWDRTNSATEQNILQKMAKDILNYAEKTEIKLMNSSCNSDYRVYICTSSLLPNLEYIVHIRGFKIEVIIEIERN